MHSTFVSSATAILDTATESIPVDVASDHFRIFVYGAGSASILPQINSSTDHAAYVASDETKLLDLSGVEQFDVTASGGAITVVVFGYSS